MIEVQNESPLSLKEACSLPFLRRAGKPIHLATVHRWATHGAKGVKLETVQYPGGMRTTAEAVLRFLAMLNGLSATPAASKPRQHAIAAAERELAAAGFEIGGEK